MSTALLIAGSMLLSLTPEQVSIEPALVKMETRSGHELWTVRASETSVRALLERIGDLGGLEIDASTALEIAPLVTISLDRRPLEQVLEFALGSAGLLVEVDDDAIHVRADKSTDRTHQQRVGLAARAWNRAARDHPAHPIAAAARLAQGELEELRGHRESARQRYLDVMSSAPLSTSAAEAYLRAARIAVGREDWSEASEHYRALANLPGSSEYMALARVGLARATMHLGDSRGALHILDQLDATHPCWESTELTARGLIRIEALLAEERFQDALLALEASAGHFDPIGAKQAPRLRALALEGAGFPVEASRAWLLVARDVAGPARIGAYRAAATQAELADDPLSVLFACREARAAGFAGCIEEYEARARTALGPRTTWSEATPAGELRLERAENLLRRLELERATAEFAVLYRDRELLQFAPEARARLALGWVRCIATTQDIESAAKTAQAERKHLPTSDAQAQLDRGMARLFEEHGLFERAADAYHGDY